MKYILTLLAGLLIGGALVFFFLVGAPTANRLPGQPIKPPDPGGPPPGTAMIILDKPFFDTVLAAIFRDMNAPSFQLTKNAEGNASAEGASLVEAAFQNGCPSAVTLLPEGSNVKTEVRIENGKILAPLAFKGSYNAPFVGCVQFTGWAQANMALRFDEQQQAVFGELRVEGVNVDGAPPVVGSVVTGLVQGAINQRVNPLQILQAHQLRLSVPVKASDGTLTAQVKDVRAQINNGSLQLNITYQFQGQKGN
ncbi:MAG TPA: hypothetical protein VJS44_23040 [Pyrinomonadaceae bacterium]|nr:hypothetical protein [Pyrinomonadaceae bacterium]